MIDGFSVLMPSATQTALGLKLVSIFPGNVSKGLASVQGIVVLLDPETGELDAVLDAAVLTELRTAAVSALATQLLARPDASSLALVGSGVQARGHLLALREVRPLESVTVASRDPRAFVAWAAAQGFEVQVAGDVEQAVKDADIVTTVTSSGTPVLHGAWLRAGAHVNAVGAFSSTTREVDTEVVVRSSVVVDSRESAEAEAGDLLLPVAEGAVSADVLTRELAPIVAGRAPGRSSAQEITLFKSLGLAIEDVIAASAAVEAAREQGLGVELPFSGEHSAGG
jgi:alanine dehydrogenase